MTDHSKASLLAASGSRLALLALTSALLLTLLACGGSAANNPFEVTRIENSNVASSNNPLVAQYTVTVSGAGTVYVDYGTTTNYGQQTSAIPIPSGGGSVTVLVGGMKQNTSYHMRAVVNSDTGVLMDGDHTFQSGAIPSDKMPPYTVTVGAGQQPSPGVRLVSGLTETYALNDTGDVVWYYKLDIAGSPFYLTKPMPNGHMLVMINISGPPSDSYVREIDLAGNTVREISQADLAQKLTASGHNINLVSMDHDVLVLPNGHWLILISNSRVFTDLPGYPGETTVVGNGIVDVDENSNVVWVWDAFDHLDVNRHPMQFPDWTHANSLYYNSDDGSVLFSLRHQYWLLKIDYKSGTGSGDILWKLGYQGDFTLQSNTPADWFYAQHDAGIISPNQTGAIQISLFDNGNNRVLDDGGDTCNPTGQPACYSTSAIFDVDETNMTAARNWTYQLPFSFWGGSTQPLPNGNILIDSSAPSDSPSGGSRSIETTQGADPPIIWTLETPHEAPVYRVNLLPSLYPQ